MNVWWWRHYAPLKCAFTSKWLHGTTTQKTVNCTWWFIFGELDTAQYSTNMLWYSTCAHIVLSSRLCSLWSSGQLRTEPCARREGSRCDVKVGTVPFSKRCSKPSIWYCNLPSPASLLPLQETSLPWSVYGSGWSRGEGTSLSPSSAWFEVRQVSCYREWGGKSKIASVIGLTSVQVVQ